MNTPHAVATLALTSVGLLVACGGDGPGTQPNETITVNGVLRERGGDPIAGAAVVVAGKTPVTTGADGRFSIPGVAVPYDITALLASSNAVITYQGLTRSDPMMLYLNSVGADHSATISGTTPPAPGQNTFVFFSSGRHIIGSAHADPTTGQYAITVSWRGAATTAAGQLYFLSWTGLPPATYDAYGSKPLTITAGGNFSGNDFASPDLTDPPDQSISGSVVLPPGYSQTLRRFFQFYGRIPIYWEDQAPLADGFTYAAPATPGVVFGVWAMGQDPASRLSFFFKRGIQGNATNTTLPLAAATHLTLPADSATAVDAATQFSWSPGGGAGINIFSAFPDNVSDPLVYVYTAENDAKIPDLTGVGMGLPASARYTWQVDRAFPVASVNEAAGEEFLLFADFETGDVGETLSESRVFTTRPASAPPRESAVRPTMSTAPSPWRRGLILAPQAIPTNAP